VGRTETRRTGFVGSNVGSRAARARMLLRAPAVPGSDRNESHVPVLRIALDGLRYARSTTSRDVPTPLRRFLSICARPRHLEKLARDSAPPARIVPGLGVVARASS
jgi:hypothetical protein